MAEINWTHESQCWLKDIFDFISVDSAEAATRVIDEIYERAQILVHFPKIGHRYEAVEDREVRILLYGHYRIAYLIKPDDDIDILGVFHGSLDIQRYLI